MEGDDGEGPSLDTGGIIERRAYQLPPTARLSDTVRRTSLPEASTHRHVSPTYILTM